MVASDALFHVDRSRPRISPDGSRLAYRRSDGDGATIWVRSLAAGDERQVGDGGQGGVGDFVWSADGSRLLYRQDDGGDENWRIFALDVETGHTNELTPFPGVQVQLLGLSRARPDEVLIAMNRDVRTRHDAYVLHLASGALARVAESDGFARWLSDGQLRPHAAVRPLPDGGMEVVVRETAGWRAVFSAGPDDVTSGDLLVGANTSHMALTPDGRRLYLCSARDAPTRRLLEVDCDTGHVRVIAGDPVHDIGGARLPMGGLTVPFVLGPGGGRPQLVTVTADRLEHRVVDPAMAPDLDRLRALGHGDLFLESRDATGRLWTVGVMSDARPISYHLYDRATGAASFLFDHSERLSGVRLASMEPFSFRSRDGLDLHGYLSFPPDGSRVGMPAVLCVHGGPWLRNTWGFDPMAQFFATRGYLCVQVNFRGSSGYGKEFMNAGDREWGGRMLDDLVDATRWCVDRGFVDPGRVAIYGRSYGGYSALMSAAVASHVFRCAIAAVAPVDLVSTMKSLPAYWSTALPLFHRRVGHPSRDRDHLWSQSPLAHVDRVSIPLLVVHGTNDARVPSGQAAVLVDALRGRGAEPELLLLRNEGHGLFRQREHRRMFCAAVERFLQRHLAK